MDDCRECRNCAERIRPVREGDGIDAADRDYYRWVDEAGNPYCDLPPDGPEQIDLIHEPRA